MLNEGSSAHNLQYSKSWVVKPLRHTNARENPEQKEKLILE